MLRRVEKALEGGESFYFVWHLRSLKKGCYFLGIGAGVSGG